jgi:hypothetical protein
MKGDHTKDVMGGACGNEGAEDKFVQGFAECSCKGQLKTVGMDGTIILKLILNRYGGRAWIWFVWLQYAAG